MKRFIFVLLLFFSVKSYAYLFVNSLPMRANVYVDGKLVGTSPVVVKEELTGRHTIRFEKTGFYDSTVTINVKDKVTNVFAYLSPFAFSIYFPNQTMVQINGKTFENEQIENIPEGFYYFKPGKEGISMKRDNPNKKFLYISAVVLGTGLASGIVGTIVSEQYFEKYKEANSFDDAVNSLKTTAAMDNLKILGYSMAGVGLTGTVYFLIDDIKYRKKAEQIKIKSETYKSDDIVLYEKAMDEYSQNNLDKAYQLFSDLINHHPESRFVPVGMMRRAAILANREKYDDAITDLEKVKAEYPIYEIYEQTLRLLGDDYFATKNYQSALDNYKEMRLVMNSYPPEDVEMFVIQAMHGLYQQKKDAALAQELKDLIKDYLSKPYPDGYKNELKNLKID